MVGRLRRPILPSFHASRRPKTNGDKYFALSSLGLAEMGRTRAPIGWSRARGKCAKKDSWTDDVIRDGAEMAEERWGFV
jgi:hypothetical protein